MKTMSRLFVFSLLVAAAFAMMSTTAFGASQLVYSDEFNGPLDTSTWANRTPWNTNYTTGELEYYDPANCSFTDGMMTLKSEKRSMNGYSYTSAIVTSLKRQKFSYGYFEMRAKLPKGQGIWPAFWLTNDSTLEIDAMEMLGHEPNKVYMTLHRNGSQVQGRSYTGPDYSAGFHTFGVDWQPTYVKWYLDGVLAATYSGAMPSDPLYICLNTAVGGAWPGSPTSATQFPVEYNVDYVRVYDTKPTAPTTLVAKADAYSVTKDTTLNVPPAGVLANDVDPDGQTLSAEPVAQPEHGTVELASDGSFVYVPTAGYTGADSFTYRVTAGAASDVNVVTISVNAPAPTVVTKPTVKRRNRARRTYNIAGAVRLSTATAAAASAAPVTIRVQVQRYTRGAWRAYKTARIYKLSTSYKTVVRMRTGKFRVRTLLAVGGTQVAASKWTKTVRIR
jgi:beta-glucanase (GH16 family)